MIVCQTFSYSEIATGHHSSPHWAATWHGGPGIYCFPSKEDCKQSRLLGSDGWGQFIRVALQQCLDFHSRNEWCIKLVCIGGRYQEEYKEILQTKEASRQ